MRNRHPTYIRPSSTDAEQARKLTQAARKALEEPIADKFLARKTQEPFPKSESPDEQIDPSVDAFGNGSDR